MYFIFILLEILPFIIVPVVIITIAVRANKTKTTNSSKFGTNSSTSFKNTISNANDANGYWNSISSEDTSVYCDYCGSKMLRSKKRCPSCGAKVQKEDKNQY